MVVKEIATAMLANGMRAAGYRYINLVSMEPIAAISPVSRCSHHSLGSSAGRLLGRARALASWRAAVGHDTLSVRPARPH